MKSRVDELFLLLLRVGIGLVFNFSRSTNTCTLSSTASGNSVIIGVWTGMDFILAIAIHDNGGSRWQQPCSRNFSWFGKVTIPRPSPLHRVSSLAVSAATYDMWQLQQTVISYVRCVRYDGCVLHDAWWLATTTMVDLPHSCSKPWTIHTRV